MKIKIFEEINYLTGRQMGREGKKLEETIQDWLQNNDTIRIRHIKQSSSSIGTPEKLVQKIVISIWYDQ